MAWIRILIEAWQVSFPATIHRGSQNARRGEMTGGERDGTEAEAAF